MKTSVLLLFFIISSSHGADHIKSAWRSCQSDNDCQLVMDLACKTPCQSDAINLKFKKSLDRQMSKDCPNSLALPVTCAVDLRAKIPRCIKKKCKLMTKHICCTLKDLKTRKINNCHIKKVNCDETSF